MTQDEIGKIAGKAIDEDSRFYSQHSGKPLKGFTLGSNVIGFTIQEDYNVCATMCVPHWSEAKRKVEYHQVEAISVMQVRRGCDLD